MLIASIWKDTASTVNNPSKDSSFQFFGICFIFFRALAKAIGNNVRDRRMWMAITQNRGDVCFSPILSMLDVIANIIATPSIYLVPFCLMSALRGARTPSLLAFKFSM